MFEAGVPAAGAPEEERQQRACGGRVDRALRVARAQGGPPDLTQKDIDAATRPLDRTFQTPLPETTFPESVKEYRPTLRDRLARLMAGDQAPSPERRALVSGLMGSTGLGHSSTGIADLTPAGGVFGAEEAMREGDTQGAVLAAAGPGGGFKRDDRPAVLARHGAYESSQARAPESRRAPHPCRRPVIGLLRWRTSRCDGT